MKPYPCIESTIEFKTRGQIFRLWLNELDIKEYDFDEPKFLLKIKDIIDRLFKEKHSSRKEMIETLIKDIPNLNAVQILEALGDTPDYDRTGIVVYTVDFENHG